jgi:hypothetical protein
VQQAAAADGQLGLLEGKAVALLHPALMAGLYLTTLYTGYQGLKWREVRTVGDDLKALQAEAKPYEARIAAAGEAGDASASAALAPLQSQISELTAKRKDMLAAGYRDKHWALASILLACGVTFSIEGGVDTYMRVGKLFPGPHLFAGAGITVLWAVAAALVPKMQKGEDWARTAHIGINVAILGLFTWQLQSGFEILDKVTPPFPSCYVINHASQPPLMNSSRVFLIIRYACAGVEQGSLGACCQGRRGRRQVSVAVHGLILQKCVYKLWKHHV